MAQNITENLKILQKKCKIDGIIDSLIHIPAGNFLYGRKKETKYLDEFYIMKYPVTVKQYRQYCEISSQKMPSEPQWGWHDSHPIVKINWFDAVAFAEFVGLVLPCEEEWEKAARGVDGRIFPWGNEWDEDKCCNGALQTSPVGSFASGASPYGVYDMSGNVCEWCDSWDVDCEYEDRIRRGGCWKHESSDFFRTFIKFYDNPSIRYDNNGIRCIIR